MAREASVVEVQAIAPERGLPPVEAPPFLLGERPSLGESDAGAIVLAEARGCQIVLRALDAGVATGGEVRRE